MKSSKKKSQKKLRKNIRYRQKVSNNRSITNKSDHYPLESYVTHVSHGSLQGAPENPSEKMTKGHFPYRIRKDTNKSDHNDSDENFIEISNSNCSDDALDNINSDNDNIDSKSISKLELTQEEKDTPNQKDTNTQKDAKKGFNITNLTLSGGGIKGVGYIGFFKALEEYELDKYINNISCSSIGAIIGTLFSIGYTSLEMEEILNNVNLGIIQDINSETILDFFNSYGLDTGNKLKFYIESLISDKLGNNYQKITFYELYKITHKVLIITGTCLNKKKTVYYSYKSHPHMVVSDAIRISISLPILYQPIIYDNMIFVDGGISDNFPIYVFDNIDRTLGVLIKSSDSRIDNTIEISKFETYVSSIFRCLIDDQDLIKYNKHKDNCILIEIDGVNLFNTNIDIQTKKKCIEIGYQISKKRLEEMINPNS